MSDPTHAEYRKEAEERWGDTEAFAHAQRRTGSYSADDWNVIREELDGIEAGLAGAMSAGATPESGEAMDLAEAARLHIDRWYYPCSHAMHAALADMYLADERFRAHYEQRAEGLAAFAAAAIVANAARG